MSLTNKKQISIRQFLMDTYDIYQDTGMIDKSDFDNCLNQIFNLWNKKTSFDSGLKYPCGCSRGRGRPRACCKLIQAGGSHKAMKTMSEEEMIKYYRSFVGDNEDIAINIQNQKNLCKRGF